MAFIINPYFSTPPPMAPDDLAGLIRWYRADSYALSDGDTIGGAGREWVDESPSGEDAVQASAPSRPFYRTNIFGALPAIEFVSANATFLTMTPASFPLNFTVIVVGKVTNHTPILSAFSSANIHCTIYPGLVNVLSFQSGSDGATSDAFSGAQTSVRQMGWRRLSPGNVSFREQNIARGTTIDVAGDASFSFDIIGANILAQYASAHIGEICIYDQFNSDFAIDSVYTNYFKPKWGLP